MTDRYFDALEQQLAGLCRQRAHRRRPARRIPADLLGHRASRSGSAAILALAGSVGVVAVVAVFALGLRSKAGDYGRPPVKAATGAGPAHRRRAAERYVNAAIAPVLRDGCAPGSPRASQGVSQGVPDHGLLSILAVLRQPREPQDVPRPAVGSHRSIPVWAKGSFLRYIRRARVVDGITYWVVPTINAGQVSARCARLARQRLGHELSKAPRSIRALAWSLGAQQIAHVGPHEGVTIVEQGPHIGSGFGGGTANDIDRSGSFGSEATPRGARLVGLLPDGVATVQISYPPLPNHRGANKPFSLTAPVVNNVLVVTVPRSGPAAFGDKMTWRKANGTIIKTIRQPPSPTG